ncbi:MAG: hypothetical protein IKA64_00560 [Clostridia bacterium]|nr:hypothetical protein [Clostridia bacterium]
MKRNKKTLLISILIIALLCLFSASAYAAEEESPESVTGAAEAEESPFSVIFEAVSEYATEIFCALSFIGSLILSFAYKKGLLPLLRGALTSLGGTVGKLSENVESESEKNKELCLALSSGLERAESVIERTDEGMKKIAERLDALSEDAGERERFNTVMREQVELLYDVFMSSSLPQYKKDEIGERVAKMRMELSENEAADKE